jgi:hypothetical protein
MPPVSFVGVNAKAAPMEKSPPDGKSFAKKTSPGRP